MTKETLTLVFAPDTGLHGPILCHCEGRFLIRLGGSFDWLAVKPFDGSKRVQKKMKKENKGGETGEESKATEKRKEKKKGKEQKSQAPAEPAGLRGSLGKKKLSGVWRLRVGFAFG